MAAGQDQTELNSIKLTLVFYALAMVLKLAGFFATGIMVLLADALHSVSDILVFGILLIASGWARKEADIGHMFGHERAQNAAALVAATLFIFVTSFSLLREAVPGLFQPKESAFQRPEVALAVIGGAMVLQAVPIIRLFLQKERTAAGKATLLEGLNDQLSTVAALIGTLFVMRGVPIIDPSATIFVAILIALNGARLFAENFSFLVGRSPGEDFMNTVRQTAYSVSGVKDVHELRAEYVGPKKVHVVIHLTARPELTLKEAHRIMEEVRDKIHLQITLQGTYCYIQIEPE
ncbi:MAG: cation diffusion facilitator family transporter [Desulfobacteraceae bacterium]|nr:cation diffusion facilitator family transporter [Desulfobacteraceae bacterium]